MNVQVDDILEHSIKTENTSMLIGYLTLIGFFFVYLHLKGICPAFAQDDSVNVEGSTIELNLGEDKQGSRTGKQNLWLML